MHSADLPKIMHIPMKMIIFLVNVSDGHTEVITANLFNCGVGEGGQNTAKFPSFYLFI